ncbi:MAG: hypothetical protein PWQ97_1699 [Tepidanaerobacteraceae bacterium]|jgi:mannitol-specific phosphotransferase system IIBC component|nr:hypothetical protein [Tepidanaerobacteraceae bacterium]MDN5312364.1 hypothetical protein [Thermoanaerobacteraceae bacterium]
MNWNRIFLGACTGAFAGYGVFTIWPSALARWNWLGGWLAAGIIITTGWLVNHYLNAMPNKSDGAWVDMALPIWLSSFLGGNVMLTVDKGLVRAAYGMFHGANIGGAFPTIILELVGATIGGFLLYKYRRSDV